MTEITLRELFEEKLARMNDRINALERMTAQWEQNSEQALKLQAAEYKQHFERLNGEQDRMARERDRTLPRETFETWRTTIDSHLSEHTRQLANVLGRTQGISGAWALAISGIAALAALGTVLVMLIRHVG